MLPYAYSVTFYYDLEFLQLSKLYNKKKIIMLQETGSLKVYLLR